MSRGHKDTVGIAEASISPEIKDCTLMKCVKDPDGSYTISGVPSNYAELKSLARLIGSTNHTHIVTEPDYFQYP